MSMYMACLRWMLRDKATDGVAQKRPRLIPETANRAVSDAVARSHIATSWQPAAVAMPWTWAITVCGMRWIIIMTSLHRLNSAW